MSNSTPDFTNFIGGTWRPARGNQTFPDENPSARGVVLARFQSSTPADVTAAIDVAPSDTTTSGIDPQFDAQGRTAIDRLVTLLTRNQRGIPPVQTTMLIEPVWKEGRPLGRHVS